jgi:ubiquinone biosynthesis protein COQ9
MAQKRKTGQSKLIAEAALNLADERGWTGLTLQDVARKARLSPEAVARVFPDTWAILLYVLKDLDGRTANAAETDSSAPWRDNLFEIMMARLEMMNAHRATFVSILPALLKNPQTAPRFARPVYDSMQMMLELAGAPATPMHAAAFGAAYLAIIDAWRRDDTPDLSKTMAAADRYLGMFERCSSCPSPVRPRPAPRRR